MAKLTDKDVKHVAKLANLKLTEKEVKKFKKQLSGVLNYVDELKELDVDGIKPTTQTTDLVNMNRKDKVSSTDTLDQKSALSGSEDVHNGYFKIEQVLKNKEE